MKVFFYFTLMLLCRSIVFAQSAPKDSVINLNGFKHNKQYFLDHYGSDDSTKALINDFFGTRKGSVVVTSIGLGVGVGAVFLLVNPKSFAAAISSAPAIITMAFVVINGPIGELIFTRKKLLRLIADYKNGKHLPTAFTRLSGYKHEFRRLNKN